MFKKFILAMLGLCVVLTGEVQADEHLSNQPSTIFCIVRHGQTDWNVEKKIQGHADIPLNETGKAEAAALAAVIKNIPFSVCFSSDLQRAYHTALILTACQSKPMTIILDERLRERNCGIWEGLYYSDFYAAGSCALQDIESSDAVHQRTFHVLHQIAEIYCGEQILVVTHGGVIRNLLMRILAPSCPEDNIVTKNTSLLMMEYSNGQWLIANMQDIHF